MRSILEELFYGNVCPNTDCRSKGEQAKELMGYIADHHDTLITQLNEKQKEIFEKFDACWDELTDINEREIFVHAFRLGANIAIDILSADYRSQKNRNADYTIFDVSGIYHYSPGSEKNGYFR